MDLFTDNEYDDKRKKRERERAHFKMKVCRDSGTQSIEKGK